VTAKQLLVAHIREDHGRRGQALPKGWTLAQFSRWHAREHWRNSPNHYHAGGGKSPDERPPGWYTGEDAVPNKRGINA
jgi:hypothetical protein